MSAALPVDPKLYGAFLGVMAVMAVTPGPANLFAVATGAAKGRSAALAGVVGMNLATLMWFVAAALGLGVLILTFPQAFRVVAVLGALYVAWLGVTALYAALVGRPPQVSVEPETARVRRDRAAVIDGFMVQVANPKLVLFFTAVLPPFVDIGRPIAPQLILFAAATIGMDALSMSAYGLGGAALSRRLTQPGFQRGLGVLVGLLLLLAAGLIVSRF